MHAENKIMNQQPTSPALHAETCCASLGDNSGCRANPPENARQTHYTLRNKDGQTIQLRGDLTMEDLVRMGYTDIRLAKPATPLKPHEWRADPLHNANVEARQQ